MWDYWSSYYNYWIFIILMMIGFYTVIAKPNYVKKVMGLSLFQSAIFLLFISLAKVDKGTAPILIAGQDQFSNPLPHAMILTAIVVSVSITAVALALIINIRKTYGTIEEHEILEDT